MVLQHVRTTKLSLIELLLYLRSQRGDTVILILLARDRSRGDERGRNYYRLFLFAFRLRSRSFLFFFSTFSSLLRYYTDSSMRKIRFLLFFFITESSFPRLFPSFLQFVPRPLSLSSVTFLAACFLYEKNRASKVPRSVCATASVIITEPVLPLTRPVNLNHRLFGPPAVI